MFNLNDGMFGSMFGFLGIFSIITVILNIVVLVIVVIALLTFIRVANTGDRALRIFINKNRKYDDDLNYGNNGNYHEEVDDEENEDS
jgi:uncharacterized membrane protein